MPLRLAILGLDLIQREWLDAVAALRAEGEVELVAVGHRSVAAARDVAGALKAPFSPAPGAGSAGMQTTPLFTPPSPARDIPAFDDVRLMLKEASPQIVLMDRPPSASLDFLLACVSHDIGLFSLGPPVVSLAEAQALSAVLEPRTHLLYCWPHFADAPASRHCAQADEFVRPIRFAAGTWVGVNYALAKAVQSGRLGHATSASGATLPVRSLSVLAWDALGALIRLMGIPLGAYAALRGTVGSGNSFADLSGAASITLRFADDAAASLTLCDRAPATGASHADLGPWNRRDLMLWGAGGTLKLSTHAYEFRDADGELIDAGPPAASAATPPVSEALAPLREFLAQYMLPPSPHRGWVHHLEEIAATMEALVVSHRTGQAESPERLAKLRR